jgi:hypothetical protein
MLWHGLKLILKYQTKGKWNVGRRRPLKRWNILFCNMYVCNRSEQPNIVKDDDDASFSWLLMYCKIRWLIVNRLALEINGLMIVAILEQHYSACQCVLSVFMNSVVSITCLQNPVTGPCPELFTSFLYIHFNILGSTPGCPKWSTPIRFKR